MTDDRTHYFGDGCDPPHVEQIGSRLMLSQTVSQAGLTEHQVIAVLRGLADYTLWQRGFRDIPANADRALEAARFCHAIADNIMDSHIYREVSDE